MGLCYKEKLDYPNAIAAYTEVLNSNKNDWDLLQTVGGLHVLNRDPIKGIPYLKQ